jgi:hypothetical protein
VYGLLSAANGLVVDHMARKYFRASIQELEVLFKDQSDSIDVLLAIQDELAHRTTNRAARLRNRVTDRLTTLMKGVQKETVKEPPRVPPHPPRPIPRPHEEQAWRPPHIQSDRTVPVNEDSRTAPKMGQPPPLPSVANRPEEVLSAWTALEVLSPPSYIRTEDLAGGDRTRSYP